VTATNLKPILAEHPFFKDLSEKYLDTLTGCAANAVFQAGSYLFRAGEEANSFFLVREGKLAVEIRHPARQIVIQTVDPGEILGWSWLFPPYRWHFDVRAVELTRALSLDGACLRRKIDADKELGHEMMTRFARIMVKRLEAMQLQLLDVYK
jgi:CRP/FNR family cyclic AMP-dependent transcriptional regulator